MRLDMAEYYKVDGRKITLREYCNITRSWKALVAWIGARLGAPIQLSTDTKGCRLISRWAVVFTCG